MKAGEPIRTKKVIRSQKTGVLLPKEGAFVMEMENLGRLLILVNFGPAGSEYVFPEEIEEAATISTPKAASRWTI